MKFVTIKATGRSHRICLSNGSELGTDCGIYLDRLAQLDGSEQPQSPLYLTDEPGWDYCAQCQQAGGTDGNIYGSL